MQVSWNSSWSAGWLVRGGLLRPHCNSISGQRPSNEHPRAPSSYAFATSNLATFNGHRTQNPSIATACKIKTLMTSKYSISKVEQVISSRHSSFVSPLFCLCRPASYQKVRQPKLTKVEIHLILVSTVKLCLFHLNQSKNGNHRR